MRTRKTLTWCLYIAAALSVTAPLAHSQQASPTPGTKEEALIDPFDPFEIPDLWDSMSSEKDDSKSAEDLLQEALYILETEERLLDARTKLLKALKKDPQMWKIHYVLSGYYFSHVGHFRLSMKYIKRAEELFTAKHGPPPYRDKTTQFEHSNILYYLSQIRLSLDNYQGALDALDEYSGFGYSAAWYPGSRAWILMKLGRIQEAIKVARSGILLGADVGRTLNMLGILLSMNGEPQEALEVFRKAIAAEFSDGSRGQPATPLNNSGEVYKELFDDDKAESSFLRATSLPDGCEHVLPSLNLTLLYIDQQKTDAAISTLDSFQKCVAQFPLRNNEEHAALVHLARGRVDLHTGNIDRAITHFRAAMDGTQWFGKIGTNQNDLVVATTISLAQALARKNNALKFRLPITWSEWLDIKRERATNAVESWWLMRRARQLLTEELNDLEDLSIRNTDSLLEYSTLGEVLRGLSGSALSARLDDETRKDSRVPAKLFYQAYLAESRLSGWSTSEAISDLDTVIERARPRYDDLLKTHTTLLRMGTLDSSSSRYRELAYRIFYTSPAELRNYGYRLPVRIQASSKVRDLILSGPFTEDRSAQNKDDVCLITSQQESVDGGATLRFTCPHNSSKNQRVEDSDPRAVMNKLTEALFREEIKNGSNV
jgi:tetratricopeptide (TPR) repeat protein